MPSHLQMSSVVTLLHGSILLPHGMNGHFIDVSLLIQLYKHFTKLSLSEKTCIR